MSTAPVQDAPRAPEDIHLSNRGVDVGVECSAAEDTESSSRGEDSSLSRADGGAAAWKMLISAFLFEALFWGFPLSFGVFQRYYSELPQFADDPYVSVVGSVATGISYMGAPFIISVIRHNPRHLKHMIWAGWVICILSLIIGSFATTLAGLILSQGVMYGFGFLVLYYPIIDMITEHWVARRGMACGVLCASSGVSGVVMPFITKSLLDKYGYPTTLRAVAIGLAILTAPLIPSLKGRLPLTGDGSTRPGKPDWSFFQSPLFWVFTASNIFQGIGFFFPSLYLPSFAAALGLGTTQGALVLALMSIAQVFGQFSFGYLSDRRSSLGSLLIISTVVSAVAVLSLWGLSKSLAPLSVFSLLYGFFGAGYVAMWARMAMAVSSEPAALMPIFGAFCFQKGVGNVLSGPIGAGLVSKAMSSISTYGVGEYRSVIIFTGTSMFASAVAAGFSFSRLGSCTAATQT